MKTCCLVYRTMAAVSLALVVSCGGSGDGAGSGGSAAAGNTATGGGAAGTSMGTGGTSTAGAGGASTGGSSGGSAGAGGSLGGAGGTSTGGSSGGPAGAGGSLGGAGGKGTAGNSGAAISATWTFPSLITTGTVTATFPTYVAHLLGKQITEPFPTDFACALVANSGASAGTAHLTVSLGVYGAAVTADVSVPAGSNMKTCLTPTFDKTALYALTAPDIATLVATAKDAGDADLGSSSMTVSIPPVDDIPWSANGIDPKTLKEMAVVYVEPNALDIDKLQRLALQYSAFGVWDSGSGPYQRNPLLEIECDRQRDLVL